MKRLADFKKLTKAEGDLVKWLQAGNRKVFVLGQSVPDGPSDAVTLGATFVRYLALGGCTACRLPETGLRVQGAYIDGDEEHSDFTTGIDLSSGDVKTEIHLIHCRIPDKICLVMTRGITFDLSDSILDGGLDARGLKATGGIQLNCCRICHSASLLGASLEGSFDANKTIFTEYQGSILDSDGIKRMIDCRGINIGGGFRLMNSTLEESIDLTGANIKGNLNLLGSSGGIHTSKSDHTRPSEARQFLVANRISVSGDVNLRNCSGPSSACAYSRIEGDLKIGVEKKKGPKYFSELNLRGTVIRQCLEFRTDEKLSTKFDLQNLMVARLNDNISNWPDGKNLKLNGIRIGTFETHIDAVSRSKWLEKRGDDFFPQPWEETAKVLREMGHGEDARAILIEKERLQRAARRKRLFATRSLLGILLFLWFGFWDWVVKWTVRYGRQPLTAFLWLFLVWLLGWAVFAWAAGQGDLKPNLPQTQVHPAWVECAEYGARRWASHATQVECFRAQPEGKSYPHFNALFYSADTLFPVVSLEMQSYWIPDDTKPLGMLARWYLWAHIIAGWALTLLAVAGFSGLIKTDNTK